MARLDDDDEFSDELFDDELDYGDCAGMINLCHLELSADKQGLSLAQHASRMTRRYERDHDDDLVTDRTRDRVR